MNENQYWDQVTFLEAQNSSEPLLTTLKAGYNLANAKIYLPIALKRIDNHKEPVVKPVFKQIDEKISQNLNKQYGIAYGKVCKKSNELHQYPKGAAPNSLISEILALQSELDVIADKLNGTYEDKEVQPIKLEGEDKVRKILSIRVMISKKKKQLDELLNSSDIDKIKKLEQQLYDYQTQLSSLENNA